MNLDFQINTQVLFYIIIWIIALIFIIRKRWGDQEVATGFSVIYIANICLIHLVGVTLYLFPWHWYINAEWMLTGFRESTYGIIAFAFGNLFLSKFFKYPIRIDNNVNKDTTSRALSILPKRYFIIGVIAYFILPIFFAHFPTADALIGAGQQLMVIGHCLICWQAWREKDKIKFKRWFLFACCYPFISVVTFGFIGYGTSMFLIIFLFTTKFFHPKRKILLVGLILSYFGLCFYITYRRDREDLRAVIWGGASISARVGSLKATLSKPMWFNPLNLSHLENIDDRMNQNILVGKAVKYLESGAVDYARGKTLESALLALIPRIFWREKPIFAGSPDIVSRYTGMIIGSETSVGVGQVMELYINFGRPGVIIGFLIFGIFIAMVDVMSGHYLLKGDLQKFVVWFLPGTALLNVGGSLVEVTASAGGGILVAFLLSLRYRELK